MSAEDDPELDFVLRTLAQRRARFICYFLMAEDIADINELFLAREVAAWETGIRRSQVSTEKVTQVLDELQNDLLPRLHRATLIKYDKSTGSVQFGSPPESFARILSICRSIDHPDNFQNSRD